MTVAENPKSLAIAGDAASPGAALIDLAAAAGRVLQHARRCDEEMFEELFVERHYAWGRMFVINDPDGIKRVLQDNVDNYPRIDPIRRVFAFGSGSGMLCAEGEVWRRTAASSIRRSTAAPSSPMCRASSRSPRSWRAASTSFPAVRRSISARCHAFSDARDRSGLRRRRPRDRPMVLRMGHYPGEYGLFDFLTMPRWLRFIDRFRKSRREAKALHPLLARMLAERREPGYRGPQDLLWRLANARDRQTGESLSIAELEDEVLTLGSTSVTSLQAYSWIWYLLALHPWAEARVEAELDAVLGDGLPQADDLGRLVYLRKVVDEAMRLYPPCRSCCALPLRRSRVRPRIPRKSVVAVIPGSCIGTGSYGTTPTASIPSALRPKRSRRVRAMLTCRSRSARMSASARRWR